MICLSNDDNADDIDASDDDDDDDEYDHGKSTFLSIRMNNHFVFIHGDP